MARIGHEAEVAQRDNGRDIGRGGIFPARLESRWFRRRTTLGAGHRHLHPTRNAYSASGKQLTDTGEAAVISEDTWMKAVWDMFAAYVPLEYITESRSGSCVRSRK